MNPQVVIGADVLASVTAPSLFIWGDEDPMGGVEVARPFVEQFPNGRLEIITEAGHAPFIDEPEHCAELMRKFLSEA